MNLKKFTVVRIDANSTKQIITPEGFKKKLLKLVEKLNLDYRPNFVIR